MKKLTIIWKAVNLLMNPKSFISLKAKPNIFNFNKYEYILPHRQFSTINTAERCSLKSAEIFPDVLRIQFASKSFDFPFVWLRDNCQCDQCFHIASNSRIIHWKTFDVNIQASKLTKNSDDIEILWSDGHVSIYSASWLHERNFSLENEQKYLEAVYKPVKIPWNRNDFDKILKNFEFEDILKDHDTLQAWLYTLSTYGVAIIKNVPPSPDSCKLVANRVDFIKKTHYGEEFTVQAKPGTTNVAYLSSNLQMHTDLPYYEYKPGLNLLHCVTQSASKGGDNLLSDGLFIANHLKQNDKKCYKILSETLVDWEDIGEERNNQFHSIFRSPVICVNPDGEIVRINHSVPQRGSHFNVPIEMVKPWYNAMKTFINMIYEQSVSFKMVPGDILCFDNRRLLHGRTEYKDTAENIRHVIGVYLDWDYIYSRLRVLNNLK